MARIDPLKGLLAELWVTEAQDAPLGKHILKQIAPAYSSLLFEKMVEPSTTNEEVLLAAQLLVGADKSELYFIRNLVIGLTNPRSRFAAALWLCCDASLFKDDPGIAHALSVWGEESDTIRALELLRLAMQNRTAAELKLSDAQGGRWGGVIKAWLNLAELHPKGLLVDPN